MNKYTFFYNGPFSQWYKSNMIIDGIKYETAEKFLMAQKALLFEDFEIYPKIMATTNPAEQKALGREIKNFDKDVWEANCRDIVMRGNIAKFMQNPKIRESLLATEGTELVEASPTDKIWGIGLAEDDPKAQIKEEWQGTNWLGIILTEVRTKLINNAHLY